MSRQEQLNLYIGQLQQRLRTLATARGAAVVAGVALGATILLTILLNAYAFPEHGLGPARLALVVAIVAAVALGLALPFVRLDRRRSIVRAESRFPELEQRLVTFAERQQAGDPFIELLAGDTLTVAQYAPPASLVPSGRLIGFAAASIVCAGVLLWTITAAPGFMGYGASLLWTGPKKNVAPLYEIRVTPGNAAVRRNSDELVTAQVIGLDANKVTLHARFGDATTWEPVEMQPQEGHQGFQFIFAALPQSVEYYVEAGPVQSKHFKFRVVDLPSVKSMQVTYHYPKWTGLQMVSEEHGGDLSALEGTDAEITVVMDSPLRDGMLMLDSGQQVHLTGGEGNRYHGTIHMEKDGAYHVAATDQGQQVRLSEDYFISTNKANPPQIAIDRPGADYRASPIEEVTIGVKAGADFGLQHVSLHYSVNGGPAQAVDMLKQPGAKDSSGTATLRLEDYKLVPGDVISVYATAKDAHAESHTEMSFIQVDPFEREFSQSQQSGGGGGGGGGQGNAASQTDISRREKELIAATWKQQNDKGSTPQHAAEIGKTLSEAQATLREQVIALSARMESRDLSSANEEFTGFEKDMQVAAAAMVPSASKLKQQSWADAMPDEQKALQALLRAEATFRQIQVAFGQQGGGGGGGGSSAGRDLASLFDLEMDTEKNQYETAQTGSPAEEQAKKVSEALEKLDALAKRQEELAQQQGNQAQNFQQRWQQEMLRREAEQLQREMEQMQQSQAAAAAQSGAGGKQSQGQQSQSQQAQNQQQGQGQSQGQSGSNGSQSGGSQAGGQSGGQSGSQAGGTQTAGRSGSQPGGNPRDGGADPRVQQALDRLRNANEAMRRAVGQTQAQNGQQQGGQGSEQARRAAEQLREATNLLGGAQRQQSSSKLDGLRQEAERLASEEASQAARIKALAEGAGNSATAAERGKELSRLVDDRQKMSDDLAHLQKGMRDTARELAATQPTAASKLRDTLGTMDESDLGNRVQRTSDWLRRGINPNSNGNEAAIASDLKQVAEGLRQAQQGMGQGRDPQGRQGQGTETAALDHVDRLRSQIESMRSQLQRGQSGQNGQQAGNQQGQGNRSGQPGGQQPGGQQSGSQQGNGQQSGGQQGGGGNRQRNAIGENGQYADSGDVGNRIRGGGGGGVANYNVDTGNSGFDRNAKHVQDGPHNTASALDSERAINQGLQELTKLRQLTKSDPAAAKEVQDLVKEMQQLDPSRFPGNPAMVEQLHTQVLQDIDKLELQLRRNSNDPAVTQVRTSKAPTVPAGYQDAVAEYYRRLGKVN